MSKCVLQVDPSLHGMVREIYPHGGMGDAEPLADFSDSAIMAVLKKAQEGDVDALCWLEDKELIRRQQYE